MPWRNRLPGIRPAAVAAAFLAAALPAAAQNVGTISGVVKDSQGLAVPGAAVELTNRISQATQSAVTGMNGEFSLGNVAFGTYVLRVSLAGFTPAEQVIELRSSVPVTANLELRVGGVEETVNVSADALLETSSTGSHIDIGSAFIDKLPSATPSKQLSAVLLSAPGFIPSQNGRIHVRGSHGQIQYVVDGVPMTDEYSEAFANPLDPRYVKAASVITGGIPAEYGGKLGAVVDLTSKSGLDEPTPVFGDASITMGRFAAVDGGATVGGRISSRVGYFLSGGGNRTDRYLDPPTTDNFHNSGRAARFTGKVEFRPTDTDFIRGVVSVNASRFGVPNRPEAEAAGVDLSQHLTDNSQTVTWLRQIGSMASLDVVAYRRAAQAEFDGLTGVPLGASQDRTLDHQGVNASLSLTRGPHQIKIGVQYDRNPVEEHFRMVGTDPSDPLGALFDPSVGGTPFVFDGAQVGHVVGLFVQDAWSPTDDLHVNAGVRYDRSQLLIDDSQVSPRVGVAYHLHRSETVFRASYNRIFMEPFAENLLLSSSQAAHALAPNPDQSGGTVQPERQHAFEVGAQQAFGTAAKLDVAYYRKAIRNVADVDQFFDTTVTFPLSVARGLAQGVEARLDVPVVDGVSAYASVARASILLTAPLTGGLFLEETPAPGEPFYADHDQRWQSQFGVSVERTDGRFSGSVTTRVDSGIPFELPEDFDPATFEDPQALTLVNVDTGRAKARAVVDVMAGAQLLRRETTRVELQVGVLNAFDKTYLLNFLSIFNGTHYGAPRTWTARLRLSF